MSLEIKDLHAQIPGRELLSDPNEGIERFLRTVQDVKLHFVTYSYSGN